MRGAELNVDRRRLVAACDAFKDCREQLAQDTFDCGDLDDLCFAFQAGWELLSCFPPNESASELSMLETQLESHKAFSMSRMIAQGWSFESSCLSASLDYGAAIVNLREILDDHQIRNAVAALSVLSIAVNFLGDFAMKQSDIDEALRLQVSASCS